MGKFDQVAFCYVLSMLVVLISCIIVLICVQIGYLCLICVFRSLFKVGCNSIEEQEQIKQVKTSCEVEKIEELATHLCEVSSSLLIAFVEYELLLHVLFPLPIFFFLFLFETSSSSSSCRSHYQFNKIGQLKVNLTLKLMIRMTLL